MKSHVTIWSNGGGRQSCAIAALICDGRLPKPDCGAIVDTGRETRTTWEYLDAVVRPELEKIGVPMYRVKSAQYATVGLYAKNGDLLLPVYTRQNGTLGKLPTYCSSEWKERVLHRWLRENGVVTAEMWMGMSWDELDRMKESSVKWIVKKYPLIETVRMRAHECIGAVLKRGWPPPPRRSRCYICPNQTPAEWQDLPSDEQAAAVELDEALREKDPNMYLHRSGNPLRDALSKPTNQDELPLGVCGGHCFV